MHTTDALAAIVILEITGVRDQTLRRQAHCQLLDEAGDLTGPAGAWRTAESIAGSKTDSFNKRRLITRALAWLIAAEPLIHATSSLRADGSIHRARRQASKDCRRGTGTNYLLVGIHESEPSESSSVLRRDCWSALIRLPRWPDMISRDRGEQEESENESMSRESRSGWNGMDNGESIDGVENIRLQFGCKVYSCIVPLATIASIPQSTTATRAEVQLSINIRRATIWLSALSSITLES